MEIKIKISIIGEVARIIGRELSIMAETGEKISELLDKILKGKNMGYSIISRDHIVVVNGKIVDKNYKIKEGDNIQIVPIYFGG